MERSKTAFRTIDEYIASFPEDIRETLQGLRETIRAAAPGAEERISYQIPTFVLKGNLVHFAAFQKHVGFYPTSSGVRAFKRELAGYDLAKGTVRFPIGRPLPLKLIGRIVRFRVAENLRKERKGQGKRSRKGSSGPGSTGS
jgi:uncharacterized protein YdhG (YjbR/CyaY superfamily)